MSINKKMRSHKGKVFCIGSIKTGTTSVGVALKSFGLNHKCGGWKTANRFMPLLLAEDWDALFSVIDKHDSFDDIPFSHGTFYKELHKKYPDAKFIMTNRDSNVWYRSITNQLRYDVDENVTPLEKCKKMGWNGLYDHILITYGEKPFKQRKQEIIRIFEERNANIKMFFKDKPDKLLVLNIKTKDNNKNALLLKKFVGSSVSVRFPHRNKTKQHRRGL